MTSPAAGGATYQDVLDAPPNTVAELVAGELHVQPRPTIPHANATTALSGILGPRYRRGRGGPGGWVILFEPELHLSQHVLVPDLAGWRRTASPDLDLSQAFATVAPQWVCEVLSPSTSSLDRVRKLPIYAAHGVEHAWLLDPLARTLEVFRRVNDSWLLVEAHADQGAIRAEPFPEADFDLADLWIDAA